MWSTTTVLQINAVGFDVPGVKADGINLVLALTPAGIV